MCRGILERGEDSYQTPAMTFTEEEMRTCADERAAAKEGAAHKRKPRRPSGENGGAGWRGPQPLCPCSLHGVHIADLLSLEA